MSTTFLYSTSPSPHEHSMVAAAQSRPGRRSGPVRIAALLAAESTPSPEGLKMLRRHFCSSAIEAELVDCGIQTRADASTTACVRILAGADLILLGGGDPERLDREFGDTPAHAALHDNWLRGAVVAGCSAGAVVLGSGMVMGSPGRFRVRRFWGWLDRVAVAPHFESFDEEPWHAAFPTDLLLGIPNGAMAMIASSGRITSLGPQDLVRLEPTR